MELRLKGFGTIKITDATRVDGDDILVKSADGFRKIAETIGYDINEVILSEVYFNWSLVAWINTGEDNLVEDSVVYNIENQDDVYRLNAAL